MPDKPDILTALLASRGIAGEEQHEQINYNVHTQVLVQLAQGVGLILALASVGAGLYLLALTLTWLASTATSAIDRLAVSAAIGGGALLLYLAAGHFTPRSRLWRGAAALLLSAAATLITLNLFEYLAHTDGWTTLHIARVLIAPALIAAGCLLVWRFSNELYNPAFPKSPLVQVLENLVANLTPEPRTVTQVQPYPVYLNGHLNAAGVAVTLDHERDQEQEPEPDPPPTSAAISDQFLDLIRLIELARGHGWQRDNLVSHPRRLLPSGRKLSRPYYEKLMDELEHRWNIIAAPGPGSTAEWRIQPADALQILTAVLDTVTAEPAGQPGRQPAGQPGRQPGRQAA